jgi:hypothetical protein
MINAIERAVKERHKRLTAEQACRINNARRDASLAEFADEWLPEVREVIKAQTWLGGGDVDCIVGRLLPYLADEFALGTTPAALAWLWFNDDTMRFAA